VIIKRIEMEKIVGCN